MEMKTITIVEIAWSVNVFFFKPAIMPKTIPKGTDTKIVTILIDIEVGKRVAIIEIAEAFGLIAVDLPQSHLVTILPNHVKYWSMIGLT